MSFFFFIDSRRTLPDLAVLTELLLVDLALFWVVNDVNGHVPLEPGTAILADRSLSEEILLEIRFLCK